MPLSKETAAKIVNAVIKDSESRKRIDSPLGAVMPARLGLTGSIRNLSMIARLMDPTEKAVADLTCVGIAHAASDAVTAANVPGVASALPHDRPNTKTEHTALLVVMKDGSEFVFDWHATLQSNNPKIFRKKFWDKNLYGALFSEFKGFK